MINIMTSQSNLLTLTPYSRIPRHGTLLPRQHHTHQI